MAFMLEPPMDFQLADNTRRPSPLPESYQILLRSWLGRPLAPRHRRATLTGTLLKSVTVRGVTIQPHTQSAKLFITGNSHVITATDLDDSDQWEPYRVEGILRSDEVDQPLLFARRFAHLSGDDASHDHYREFPIAGGRIHYAELEQLEIIPLTQVKSHFALTPDVCPRITRSHVHILPLDRVSSHQISQQCRD